MHQVCGRMKRTRRQLSSSSTAWRQLPDSKRTASGSIGYRGSQALQQSIVKGRQDYLGCWIMAKQSEHGQPGTKLFQLKIKG